MSETREEPKAKTGRPKYVLVVLAVVVILAGFFAFEASGFLCAGPCGVLACTPARPCTWNGTLYTAGKRCEPTVGEGSVCDSGVVFDCFCTTVRVANTNPKELACSCR